MQRLRVPPRLLSLFSSLELCNVLPFFIFLGKFNRSTGSTLADRARNKEIHLHAFQVNSIEFWGIRVKKNSSTTYTRELSQIWRLKFRFSWLLCFFMFLCVFMSRGHCYGIRESFVESANDINFVLILFFCWTQLKSDDQLKSGFFMVQKRHIELHYFASAKCSKEINKQFGHF